VGGRDKMLRKLERPSCVLVAENHKNLLREVRKLDARGGGVVFHFYGRQATFTVLVALQNIGFYHPRVAFRQLCINCRRYFYRMSQPRRTVSTFCQKYGNILNYSSSYALGTHHLQKFHNTIANLTNPVSSYVFHR